MLGRRLPGGGQGKTGKFMKIEILGTGCTTCNTAEAIVKDAVAKSGVEAQVIKVSNR